MPFKNREDYNKYKREYRARQRAYQAQIRVRAQAYNDLADLCQIEGGKIVQQSENLVERVSEAIESGKILDLYVMYGYSSYLGAITALIITEEWELSKVYRQLLATINLLIQQAPKDRSTQFIEAYKATKYVYKKLLSNPNLPEVVRNTFLENEKMLDSTYELISNAQKNAQIEESFTLSKWVV